MEREVLLKNLMNYLQEPKDSLMGLLLLRSNNKTNLESHNVNSNRRNSITQTLKPNSERKSPSKRENPANRCTEILEVVFLHIIVIRV